MCALQMRHDCNSPYSRGLPASADKVFPTLCPHSPVSATLAAAMLPINYSYAETTALAASNIIILFQAADHPNARKPIRYPPSTKRVGGRAFTTH